MGKFEVFEYLLRLRLTGDDEYRRYADVHEEMKSGGQSFSYTSVWRSLNSLFSDGLVEADFEVCGLQRTARFRARLSSRIHSSHMKRVHNILLEMDEESSGDELGERQQRQALALAVRGDC